MTLSFHNIILLMLCQYISCATRFLICYNACMCHAVLRHRWTIVVAGSLLAIVIIFVIIQQTAQSPADKSPGSSEHPLVPQTTQQKPTFTFPAGGKTLLPAHRFVALYGTPDLAVLGSLGEQPVEQAIARVKALAAEYQPFSDEPIYPAFEIISTIAAAEATPNGDYSREISIEKLRPWVDAAKSAGVYVILDLQPGLTDFLTQAKQYEELLREPHVGLALDPEWRLKPGQRHMKQVGAVEANEVQLTADWLADFTKQHDLPQKLLLIHQFKLSMIANRHALNTSRTELAWLIQMDGLGAPHVKQDTWRTITADAPSGIYYGWKNFYDEDKPMLTPEQTMSTVIPKPWYVSYQ